MVRADREAGLIVSDAFCETDPAVGVILAVVVEETPFVAIVNDAEFCPPGTRTTEGGTALAKLDERPTVTPPVGARPLKVTVPVEETPATTDAGATVRLEGRGGVTVSVPVVENPPDEAGIVAEVGFATEVVVTVKLAVFDPC
jgi:hypothetical protein